MSTAIPPMPAEVPAAQPLSEPQRIINAYLAPSKTFADIRRNQRWWVPWLLITIVGFSVGAVMVNKINFEQMLRQQIESSSRASQFESLPKAQQEQQLAIGMKVARILTYVAPLVAPLIGGLIVAALLMATFNFGFEARVNFMQALAIVFYSWLPGVLGGLLAIITLSLRSDTEGINPRNVVATNPAYFMDPYSGSKFLYGMAASLDVFAIWTIILRGIGFALNAGNPRRLSTGTAIITVAVWFLLYRVVLSAMGAV